VGGWDRSSPRSTIFVCDRLEWYFAAAPRTWMGVSLSFTSAAWKARLVGAKMVTCLFCGGGEKIWGPEGASVGRLRGVSRRCSALLWSTSVNVSVNVSVNTSH
jgi:hypothetical protein